MLGDLQLSADGATAAFVVFSSIAATNENISDVWLARTDGGESPRPAVPELRNTSRPRFSPDGTSLAFLANGVVWAMPLSGGTPQRVAETPDGILDLAWSPDSSRLAVIARGSRRGSSAGEPTHPTPLVFTRLRHRAEGIGFIAREPPQAWTCGRDGAHLVRLTAEVTGVSQIGWTPEGRVAYVSAGPGDAEEVWAVDPSGGAPERLTDTGCAVAAFAFSARGDLAVVRPEAPGEARHLRLFVGERCLTAGVDRSLASDVTSDTFPARDVPTVRWAADHDHVHFRLADRGRV